MADQFVVERQERIEASPQEVFAKVGTLENWDEWSPWAFIGRTMDKMVGPDFEKGLSKLKRISEA